jgi:peptide-methionine (S)-S-oxide reductase
MGARGKAADYRVGGIKREPGGVMYVPSPKVPAMPRHPIVPFAGLALFGLLAAAVMGFGPSASSRSPVPLPVPTATQQVATFAGGCFWSMQKAFDGVSGVVSVTAGYAGGSEPNPDYELVETGKTRYAESVQVIYDPARISYDGLLEVYWHHIDPLTENRAFCDTGPQYRSIIFYRDPAQQRAAEASKQALNDSHRFKSPIVTVIQPATRFYPAEEYHQQFYKKNPARYQAYVIGCGRNERIKELWGDQEKSKAVSRKS